MRNKSNKYYFNIIISGKVSYIPKEVRELIQQDNDSLKCHTKNKEPPKNAVS